MSAEAIFDVTRGLQKFLAARTGHPVSLLPPGDELPAAPGVNLYLYRVLEEASTRNQPWPGSRTRPPADRPALGLRLFYLLTPLGPKPEADAGTGDEAHRVLGGAMVALHEFPVLTAVHLPGFDADADLAAGLLDGYEPVTVRLVPTELDELSKIWSTINQPYQLSVVYEVSLVQLTSFPPPAAPGAVAVTGLSVVPAGPPILAELRPAAGPPARIVGGQVVAGSLEIRGSGFSVPGSAPTVRVGGQAVPVSAATDRVISAALPTAPEAGPVLDVLVTAKGLTGAPLPFAASPWLTRVTPVRTALPAAAAGRRMELSGFGFAPAREVRLSGPGSPVTIAVGAGGTETRQSATLPDTLPNGRYAVRVVLADDSATNPRDVVVVPRIDPPVAVTDENRNGKSVHALTVDGARLAGALVQLVIDGVPHAPAAADVAATRIRHTLGRKLAAGRHAVAVVVDGFASHPVDVEVPA